MKILFNCIGIKPLFFKKGGAIQKLVGYQILNLKNEHAIIVAGKMAEAKDGIKLFSIKSNPSVTKVIDFILNGIIDFIKISRIKADMLIVTHPRNFLSSYIYAKLNKKPILAWELDHDFWVPPFTLVKKLYYIIYIMKLSGIKTYSFSASPPQLALIKNNDEKD